MGIYNKDDSINDTIKNKLREGLVALKNELDLDINIDDSLLNKILENFTLDTLKIELNNQNINVRNTIL